MKQLAARLARFVWWVGYARWTGNWCIAEQWDGDGACARISAVNRWGGAVVFWTRNVDGIEWFGSKLERQ